MRQAKSLKIKHYNSGVEDKPNGFLCQIIDNDGKTILKEFFEHSPYEKLSHQFCRNYLKILTGEQLIYPEEEKNA